MSSKANNRQPVPTKRSLETDHSLCCPHLLQVFPKVLPPLSPALLCGLVYQHHIAGYYRITACQSYEKDGFCSEGDVCKPACFPNSKLLAIAKDDLNFDCGVHYSNDANNDSGSVTDVCKLATVRQAVIANSEKDGKAWALSEGLASDYFCEVIPREIVDETNSILMTEIASGDLDKFSSCLESSVPVTVASGTAIINSTQTTPSSLVENSTLANGGEYYLSERRYQMLAKAETEFNLLKESIKSNNVQPLDKSRLGANCSGGARGEKAAGKIGKKRKVPTGNQRGQRNGIVGRSGWSALDSRKGGSLVLRSTERFNEWINQLNNAPVQFGDELLEKVRQSRKNYWGSCHRQSLFATPSRKSTSEGFDFSSTSWGSSAHQRSSNIFLSDGHLKCLHCGKIGAGPNIPHHTSDQQGDSFIEHCIRTGHYLGISCGEKGELFCMKCGDFVYNALIDRERDRIEISSRFPWFSRNETRIERSISVGEVNELEDGSSCVWPGLVATYLERAPAALISAGELSLKRIRAFSGQIYSSSFNLGWNQLAYVQSFKDKTDMFRLRAPVGIFNLGSTCYMASVLQCLLHCPPLMDYFLRVGHHHASCSSIRKATGNDGHCFACELDALFTETFGSSIGIDVNRIVKDDASSGDKDCLQSSFVEKSYSSPIGKPLTPSRFLSAIWNEDCMKQVAGYAQRDAHEFLLCFLEKLGNDASSTRAKARSLNIVGSSLNRDIESKENNEENIVKSIFEGKLSSICTCEECGNKRVQTDPFLNVSLPLSDENGHSGNGVTQDDILSLEVCLKLFCKAETLMSPVYCRLCKKKTKTKKRMSFSKLPKVMCIHLKRFDAVNNKKISDPVKFPRLLDMGSYISHGRGSDSDFVDENASNTGHPSILYDLFGTVNHIGSLHQGHYKANVKIQHENHWYHCNDESVYHAGGGNGESAVLDSEGAYMLFYSRQKLSLNTSWKRKFCYPYLEEHFESGTWLWQEWQI